MADEIANKDLVNKLKAKLHIFHSIEDDRLESMIEESRQAIYENTGVNDLGNINYVELVLERCRYSYNDSLEYFEPNFQSNLLGLSLANYSKEGVGDVLPTTDNQIE